jgi:CheY-like chemotaxis protein
MDKKKILVVDDSRTALFMVTTILRKERYELVTACDGEQALEMAASEHPDLILMDVIMPRKTGFEACRELKRREDTKGIPVILVTTRGEGENVEAGFQSGATTT